MEFRDEILLRGEECKTQKSSIFLKNGKTVISVENLEFFYISDEEIGFIIGIVSRNLLTQSNFVEFQDGLNFTFSEVLRVASDTWHLVEWLI